MNRISISQAWSHATSFFNGQGVNHAIALIGVGIVVPLILQFTLGGSAQLLDPAAMARGGEAGMLAAFGATAFLVGIVNFVRSEEHTSELQSLMRISYSVFFLNKNILSSLFFFFFFFFFLLFFF